MQLLWLLHSPSQYTHPQRNLILWHFFCCIIVWSPIEVKINFVYKFKGNNYTYIIPKEVIQFLKKFFMQIWSALHLTTPHAFEQKCSLALSRFRMDFEHNSLSLFCLHFIYTEEGKIITEMQSNLWLAWIVMSPFLKMFTLHMLVKISSKFCAC